MKKDTTTILGIMFMFAAFCMFALYLFMAFQEKAAVGLEHYYIWGSAIMGMTLLIMPQDKLIELILKFWNGVIKKFFLFIVVSTMLFSCSPERKLSRLIRKHPELVKSDTIFRMDTIISSSVTHDTTLSIHQIMSSRDTIIFHNDRLTQKIFYYNDSIYIQGECAADTIIREIPIYIDKVTANNSIFDFIKWWWLLIGAAILFIASYFKYRKPEPTPFKGL